MELFTLGDTIYFKTRKEADRARRRFCRGWTDLAPVELRDGGWVLARRGLPSPRHPEGKWRTLRSDGRIA
jgi:hypothetical protein